MCDVLHLDSYYFLPHASFGSTGWNVKGNTRQQPPAGREVGEEDRQDSLRSTGSALSGLVCPGFGKWQQNLRSGNACHAHFEPINADVRWEMERKI